MGRLGEDHVVCADASLEEDRCHELDRMWHVPDPRLLLYCTRLSHPYLYISRQRLYTRTQRHLGLPTPSISIRKDKSRPPATSRSSSLILQLLGPFLGCFIKNAGRPDRSGDQRTGSSTSQCLVHMHIHSYICNTSYSMSFTVARQW